MAALNARLTVQFDNVKSKPSEQSGYVIKINWINNTQIHMHYYAFT